MRKVIRRTEEEVDNGPFGGNPEEVQKLTQMIFAPTPEQLPGLTIIPRGSSLKLAKATMMAAITDESRYEYDEKGELIRIKTLDQVFLEAFYLLQRSVQGVALGYSVALAETENMDEEDGAWDVT